MDVRMYSLIYVKINFFIQPILLKVLYRDSLEISKLFWDVKMKHGVLGQIQKTLDTKQARILKHNCSYILKKLIPVHN